MGFMVKDSGDFKNHPEGQFRAVCMDVVDLGMVENKKWGKMQHKVAIVFHTEEKQDDGRPFEIWERFTATLSEQAHLRSFLESWRGRAFTPPELAGFDLDKLIGVGAYVQIIHKASNGKTYANIGTVMLPPKGVDKLQPTPGYERRKDRKPEVSQSPEPVMANSAGGDGEDEYNGDDSLPF